MGDRVDVVVLAGGDGAVIDPTCRFKGLLPVSGKPMVQWVVEALRESLSVHQIAVVLPTAEDLGPWADLADKLVCSDGRFMDNLIAGVEAFRDDRPVLIATGDIPTLTPEAVDGFVEACLERSADFAYPLVSEEDMRAQYPGSERTYFKLVSGRFTGGNMTVAAPSLARRSRDIGQRLFELRKSPTSVVRIMGMRFVLRLMAGRLDPADVEVKAGEILGCTCAAVVTRHASIGADVDKPSDLIVSERILGERALASRGRDAGASR